MLSIIYPCSKTFYKHWAFCPCLSRRTWEYFLSPLTRYSCQLHPMVSGEQTQLQTGPPPHLMQWKPRRQLQSDPHLDKECGSGADLAHAMQIFVAEAEEEMTFINTSFIFPIINNNNNKNPQLNHSVILQSFILFCFLRIQCVSD